MILDAVRQSGGAAIGVEEERIGEWLRLGMSREGISICPETGACIGAVEKCLEDGIISASDTLEVNRAHSLCSLLLRCAWLESENQESGRALGMSLRAS